MDRLILFIILAIGLYQMDWLNKVNPIWMALYIILSIIHVVAIKKIDSAYEIQKSRFAKINNFFLQTSVVVGLLIIIYWFNGASLWEWRLLHYVYIRYLVFMVFFIPVFFWFQIFLTQSHFAKFKRKNILAAIYLCCPLYFYDIPKSDTRIYKTRLLSITLSLILIISYLWVYHIKESYIQISPKQNNNTFGGAPSGLIRKLHTEY